MNENTALTSWEKPEQLQNRVQRMLEIQQQVMKTDIDYGIIPGCKKPSLFKPGAELLMVTFCLSDRITVEELSEDGAIRYRVTTEICSQSTGAYLGCGVGEASTNEEKYKWRKIVCDGEWDDTPPELRREKWFKGWQSKPDYKQKQVRTNPSDVANTVLKMAKKRSKIDAVLSVLGASRIYSQDIEDMSKELQEIMKDTDNPKPTKPKITQPTQPVKQNTVPGNSYTIQEVTIKDGTGKNGPWTKYGIKIDGEYYGTFSTTEGKLAEECKKNKIPVTFTWEQSGKYRNLLTIQKAESMPEVSDHNDFKATALVLAANAGVEKIDQFLQEQLKIESLDKVLPEQQSQVIDLLTYHAELNK